MVNVEYEINRLEGFYNFYESIKDPSWLIKMGLPWIADKLAELYAVRDMQIQHTYKVNKEEVRSHKDITMVAAAGYAEKALPPNTHGNMVH